MVQNARFMDVKEPTECEALYEALKTIQLTTECRAAHDQGIEALTAYIR